MSCVNNRYTPDELESIFAWDMICELLPLTSEERSEIRQRDMECGASASCAGSGTKARDEDAEARRKKIAAEASRRYRERNKAKVAMASAAYRNAHREEINERQREYDRLKAKAGRKRNAHHTAQP